jgi:drug/metabolite transporter (DMT)-like permease
MTDTTLGYLLAVAALLFFTTGTLVTRAASSRLELSLGFLVATSVNVIFSAAVLALQWWLRPQDITWDTRAFWLFALAGVFATYLGRFFFYESVVRFGPAKASVFQVSSPLFTALIAWLLLGEAISMVVAAGMVLTIGGLMLVSAKPAVAKAPVASAESHAKSAVADTETPDTRPITRLMQSVLLLGLCSSLAYAVGNVLRGAAIRSWNEPVLGALVGAVFGLALHVLFSSGRNGLAGRLREARPSGVALFALMGVTTISAQMCTIAAMRYIPLSVATLVTLCTPILVFPLSHWFYRNQDEITARTVVGSVLTLAGIFVIVLR